MQELRTGEQALVKGHVLEPRPRQVGLVRIESRTPGAVPDFEEIRPQLEREWSHENRLKMREVFNDELLKLIATISWAGAVVLEPICQTFITE